MATTELNSRPRQRPRRSTTTTTTMLLTCFMLLMVMVQESLAHRDWMQTCSNCHCHWNSGKKSADCKSKKLTKIPQDMSNEMQVVDFSQNQIPELRREEFLVAGLQNLHKIYLRNCTIQEVNRDAFKGLPILIELDMSSNRIRQLHPSTFESLERLRNVIINNNEIEVLESRLFINLPFLSRVEFNNNRLKQVQLNVFGGPLSAISLEQNQLTHLHKETFDNLPKLTYLSLQGNAWNCSCDLQEFRDFAIAKRLYTPPTDCREPPQLRGKLWSEVPSENFACRPRILGSVRSFVEANHDNITLPCRIVGTPRPNVTWIYNKRQLNPGPNDQHIRILNSVEQVSVQQQPPAQVMTSELRIYGVRTSDKGAYICIADNRGGKAEAEFQLLVNGDYMGGSGSDGLGGLGISGAIGASTSDPQTSIFLVICVIVTTFLVLLIFLVLTLFWYCRRVKTYQKDNTMMSSDGLISCKLDKTHNSSMLEGSVIMEMQKSLLNEVNPVEKPPRRTDIESVDGGDDGHEIKKTLLDETAYANHSRDDETHSVALSDTTTTPRSRHTYVDDTYGNSLPPDLLAFPARVPPTSPSMQSSQSNIPDQVIYGIRSPPPLTSPVYAHMTPHGIYGTTTIAAATHNGFMTLQHPKSRNLALIATANSRHQQQQQMAAALQHQHQQSSSASPFLPAPVVYSPASSAVVMKQGYMTIPRKPRVPSWAPSTSGAAAAAAAAASGSHHGTQLNEFHSPTSPNPSETGTATTAELQAEPVYDNLGLRTTAGGNSILNLHKISGGQSSTPIPQQQPQQQQYTMRDRPLPATPSLTSVASAANNSKIYEPIHELIQQQQAMQAQQQHQQQQQQHQQQLQQQHLQHLYNTDTEPLYGPSTSSARHHGITIMPGSSISGIGVGLGSPTSGSLRGGAGAVSPTHNNLGAGDSPKIAKIPPRPPPKPKKKMSVTATRSGQGSTSQLFDDEGEDGTEV